MKKIAIFGDSVLRGVVLNEENNRYIYSTAIDWAKIEKQLSITIDNRSRMGATILHGAKLLEEYLATGHECQTAIIEFGGNDCDYNWQEVAADGTKKHPPKVTPQTYYDTLNNMLDTLNSHGIKPILMTLQPIMAARYYNWFSKNGLNKKNIMKHLGDIEVIARHQEYYSNMIVDIATKRQVELVDVRKEFLLRNDLCDLICEDGIHPNEKGEQVIVKAFLDRYSV